MTSRYLQKTKRKGIKVLVIDQNKRHQGTCNRKKKGFKVFAIETEKASRYLQFKKKRHQGTFNRKRKGIKVLTIEK